MRCGFRKKLSASAPPPPCCASLRFPYRTPHRRSLLAPAHTQCAAFSPSLCSPSVGRCHGDGAQHPPTHTDKPDGSCGQPHHHHGGLSSLRDPEARDTECVIILTEKNLTVSPSQVSEVTHHGVTEFLTSFGEGRGGRTVEPCRGSSVC